MRLSGLPGHRLRVLRAPGGQLSLLCRLLTGRERPEHGGEAALLPCLTWSSEEDSSVPPPRGSCGPAHASVLSVGPAGRPLTRGPPAPGPPSSSALSVLTHHRGPSVPWGLWLLPFPPTGGHLRPQGWPARALAGSWCRGSCLGLRSLLRVCWEYSRINGEMRCVRKRQRD